MKARTGLYVALALSACMAGGAMAAGVGMTGAVKRVGKDLVKKVGEEAVSDPQRILLYSIINTVAGTGSVGFSGDGSSAVSAQIGVARDVAVDADGNFYIADSANNRIRKVAAGTGIISTVAGTGATGFNGDGIPATSANLYSPSGVAVDAAGNIYIADTYNHRIRRVLASSGNIETVAGTGTGDWNGDGPATSTHINAPLGVALDSSGTLYIADYANYRVRKVVDGVLLTVAGTGTPGFYGDGELAIGAWLQPPMDVFVDSQGDVYISDTFNHRIRKVSAATGIINTVVGSGDDVYNGDGIPATSASLARPWGVYVDAGGNIYIADNNHERIRKVDGMTGLISTVAGTGTAGYNGDGIPPTSAELNDPSGIFVGQGGDIFIADAWNYRIRRVRYVYNF